MQGSFRFFKILKKSCPMRTDLPVPNSPARIIIVFLGIPLGRTLSRASIPVSSNPGKFSPVRPKPNSPQWKINDVLPVLGTRVNFLEYQFWANSTQALPLFVVKKSASEDCRDFY